MVGMNDAGPRTYCHALRDAACGKADRCLPLWRPRRRWLYVVKFRGAGQGPKTLIAELLAGEIGRSLGLPVPDIVFVELDAALSKAEPDPEIQDCSDRAPG